MQVLMTLEKNGRTDQSHGSQAEGTGLGPAERRETFLVNMEKEAEIGEVFPEGCEVCGREARLGWELLLFPVTCEKGLWVRHGQPWALWSA